MLEPILLDKAYVLSEYHQNWNVYIFPLTLKVVSFIFKS